MGDWRGPPSFLAPTRKRFVTRFSVLWLWNFQIFADLLCQKVVEPSVAGNCGGLAGRTVDVDTVIAGLSQELDTVWRSR